MRITRVLVLLLLVIGLTATASAQATRTWVSGVGDDVNPCSRTAPCKTFAGAISKTAAGGEISVLDPGGFGAVTITKSIFIDGTGTKGSILASGTNGIVVNAASTDRVVIRGIDINGAPPSGPGLSGIRILSAAEVTIENVIIQNFTSTTAGAGRGIAIVPSSASVKVNVINTTIRNSSSHGIGAEPTSTGIAQVYLDNVRLLNNGGSGVRLATSGHVVMRNSMATSNTDAGLLVEAGEAYVYGTTFAVNGHGIRTTAGTTRVALSQIHNNTGGLTLSGGVVESHGNNAIRGNGGNQTPTLVINTQ